MTESYGRIMPIVPSPHARVASRPLTGGSRIHASFWAHRQDVNARTSLVRGWEFLDTSGALPNFVAVAEGARVSHRGECNQDAEVYKWVEAASYEVARTGDETLAGWLGSAVQKIVAAQEPGGYLHTWYQLNPEAARLGGLTNGGPDETYTAGHLLHAAVAHHRATGSESLIAVARRVVDCLDGMLFTPSPAMVTGHPGLEMALVELYRATGYRRALDVAAQLVDSRGHGILGTHRFGSSHYQDYLPVREMTTLTGHAVAGLYLMAGVVDVATEMGDQGLLDAAERIWENTVTTKSFLTGGLGSRAKNEDFGDDFELAPDSAYCETCAAIAMIMWSWRLLLATGRARYADQIERTAFNALLVGVSIDGAAFRYDNQLQVRDAHRSPACRAGLERSPWFELACCPPNVMRLLASWDHYQASVTADSTLLLHQLATAAVRWDSDTVLEVATSYPWEGRVELTYRGPEARRAVRVRVPAWAGEATVDGRAVTPVDGHVDIVRTWHDGDVVRYELRLEPRWTVAHPRVDALRGTVALERGPLVYCVEQAGAAEAPVDDLRLRPEPVELTEHWDDAVGVLSLDVPVDVVDVGAWEGSLYRRADEVPATPVSSTSVRAVPYFAWGNRGVGPMRVFLPIGGAR